MCTAIPRSEPTSPVWTAARARNPSAWSSRSMSRAKRIARASRTLILRIRSRQVAGSNPAGGSERRTSPRQRRTDAEARTFRLAPTCQVLGAACDSSKPCCDLTTPPQALLACAKTGCAVQVICVPRMRIVVAFHLDSCAAVVKVPLTLGGHLKTGH
jgi:hypothetical protein